MLNVKLDERDAPGARHRPASTRCLISDHVEAIVQIKRSGAQALKVTEVTQGGALALGGAERE